MSDAIHSMKYEFFSWKGFAVGAFVISLSLCLQSIISFPNIWMERSFGFSLLIIASALIVGIASGSVLVFLFPPDQDVIGLAGLGSDELAQHLALILVIISLIQPVFAGFVFFYDYFSLDDILAFVWVLLGFAAPSAGFAMSMFDRTRAIANDLEEYFKQNRTLDMSQLTWLQGHGPRTSVYRMGMLESGMSRLKNLRIRGHEIIKEKDPYPIYE